MKCDQTCFAAKDTYCSALNVNSYDGMNCPFYKTQAQFDEGRRKAKERLERLDYPNGPNGIRRIER